MSETIQQKLNGLSPVERLKATDKYLAEMRGVLASMDEIAALREKRGEAPSDEFGGYKRSTVEKFVAELEKQKESILSEIDREEKNAAARLERERAEREKLMREKRALERAAQVPAAQAQENNKAISELSKKVDTMAITPQDNAISGFRKGDTSLAIESMYTGLSMDIEKMRDDVLQELKYSYKQDMAIYDDLSAKIDAIKPADTAALEETLKPLGENITAMSGSLTALDEKLNALQPVDYDRLAGQVAEKMVSGIDYNALAQHIVGIMAGAGAVATKTEIDLVNLERKVDDIKDALNGAISVKQMPEFRKLDVLIADYLRTLSYDLIPDLLIAANAVRELANRFIVSGNVLRGETMLSDLRMRLVRVNVWGSSAIAAVSDAVASHGLPVTYSPEALQAFADAVREFEQSPAIPQEDLAQRVLRTKKAFLCDTDAEALDRDTLAEMLEIREEIGDGEPDKGKIDNLTELKKELMSFNLSYFIDFTPAVPEEGAEEPAPEAVSPSIDTQAILDAISRLGTVSAAQPQTPAQEETAASDVQGRIEELAKSRPAANVKKRVLRPAVSAKDNRVEKTEQPLRIVKRKIDVTGDDASLSKQIVDELAQKIANSMVK